MRLEIPLARKMIKAFIYVLQVHRVEFDIHALEKFGRRADSHSVVLRVLAALETSAERALEAFCRGKNRP